MKKLLIFVLVGAFISSGSLFGQKKFKTIEEKDNVTIAYRWKEFKTPEKTVTYKLVMKINNLNDYAVNVDLELGYYWDLILKANSGEMNYCLKAKKSIIGDMKRGRFDSSDFTYDQLCSDKFELQLNQIKITKVEDCKLK